MKVLFTCIGTSDPVRGGYDGPMLHIIRHYRPDRVCIFLSGEIAKRCAKDQRFEIMEKYIREHWSGYAPQFELIKTDITDPSDLDAVSGPITEKVIGLASMPNAEVLLNLSSGTPQMKTVLAMLSCDTRYKAVGIQVKTHEKSSGTTERTNKDDYDAELEFVCNRDEEPGMENRCVEPELLHLERQKKKEQVIALLEQRNYSAVYAMKNVMPGDLKALVGHLEARDNMQYDLASNRKKNLNLPFELYPKKEINGYSDYDEVSEAYLILLNRQHRKQYEEMVLRMNPLVVRLELRLLRSTLFGMGIKLEDIIYKPYSDHPKFLPEMLKNSLPDVYEKVSSMYYGQLRESDIGMRLCLNILRYLPVKNAYALDVFEKCDNLNDTCRNELAHQLKSVGVERLVSACGMEPAKLLGEIGNLIEELYPECDRTLFTVYKRCGDYIKEKLV